MAKPREHRFFDFDSDNQKSKPCGERSRASENPRWWGIFAVVFTFTFGAVMARAQQPRTVFRIGYLSTFDLATESARAEGVRLALRDLGYREGENIAIDYRFAEQKLERLPKLAAELARFNVGIILVTGDASIRAAKNATKTIP